MYSVVVCEFLFDMLNVVGRTVVGKRADHLHDQSTSADCVSTTANTEVSVLPKQTCILFMYADDVLDHKRRAVVLHVCTRLRHKSD